MWSFATRLKEMLGLVAKDHKAKIGYAANEFNADNGAMIAFVAERMIMGGFKARLSECNIEQRYRADRATVF